VDRFFPHSFIVFVKILEHQVFMRATQKSRSLLDNDRGWPGLVRGRDDLSVSSQAFFVSPPSVVPPGFQADDAQDGQGAERFERKRETPTELWA
jgi:hypothetical protein